MHFDTRAIKSLRSPTNSDAVTDSKAGLTLIATDQTKTKQTNSIARVMRLGWGKVRRFYLHKFRRGYIQKQAEQRKGDCGRCAACCKLLYKCPFLDESGPIALCSIHDRRPDNCRFFPIDPRDLADRDFVDPENPCGFYFPGQSPPHASDSAAAPKRHGLEVHSKHAMGD